MHDQLSKCCNYCVATRSGSRPAAQNTRKIHRAPGLQHAEIVSAALQAKCGSFCRYLGWATKPPLRCTGFDSSVSVSRASVSRTSVSDSGTSVSECQIQNQHLTYCLAKQEQHLSPCWCLCLCSGLVSTVYTEAVYAKLVSIKLG